MCEPISAGTALALSAAATAAGTGLTMMQNSAAASAQNKAAQQAAAISSQARADERARQDAYQKEAFDRWNQQLAQTGPQAAQAGANTMQQAIQDTTAEVAQANPNTGFLPGQDRADAGTRESIAGQIATAARDAQKRVAGLAAMSGYGQIPANFGTANNRFGADLGLLVNKSRGSLAIGQVEGNPAAGTVVPGAASGLGDILTGAGAMGTRYAGSKGAFG